MTWTVRSAALLLLAVALGCGGSPLDKVFAKHQPQLDECLGYRLDAEQKETAAAAVRKNKLSSAAAKLDAQVAEATAKTLRMTHDACVTRLLEAAGTTATEHGLTAEELRAAWPEWYDARAMKAGEG